MPFVLKPGEVHVGIWPFHRRTLWKAPQRTTFWSTPVIAILGSDRYLLYRFGRKSTSAIR